jgi:hypothetical protein
MFILLLPFVTSYKKNANKADIDVRRKKNIALIWVLALLDDRILQAHHSVSLYT